MSELIEIENAGECCGWNKDTMLAKEVRHMHLGMSLYEWLFGYFDFIDKYLLGKINVSDNEGTTKF